MRIPRPVDGTDLLLVVAQETTNHVRARQRIEELAEQRAASMACLSTLVRVSHNVLAERTFDGLLQRVADAARELTGAKIVAAGHGYAGGTFQIVSSSRAEGAAACPPGKDFAIEKGGVYMDLVDKVSCVRLTDAEMRAHPAWWGLPDDHCPLRGLLGVRMVGAGVQTIGLILATDKERGEFTAEDEDLLQQLAGLASLGLQHLEARAAAEAERDRSRQSEERLQLAQEVASIGTFEWNIQTGVNHWTPELEALYGLPHGGFAGSQPAWEQLVYPADRPNAVGLVGRAFETGAPVEGEWRVSRPDGSVRWLAGRFQAFEDESGRPLRLIGINFDITARKQADEALREARDYAQRLIETSTIMIVGLDAAGGIRVFNEAAEKLTGYTKADLEGRNWFEVLVPKDRYPQVWEAFAVAMAGGTLPVVFENPILTKSGKERHIAWRNSVLQEGDRISGTISCGIDVTDQREIERVKEQFISIAAHELKTPVAIMKGYSQALLRDGGRTPEQRRKMLEGIDHGSSRIDAVVQDLLDISKLAAGRLELELRRVDLAALVSQCVERMALLSDRHVIRMARTAPVITQGDRGRLEQAVMNLLDNAVKYSPHGTAIDVAVAVSNGDVMVSFRDRGIGIPEERQRHVFERFYSAHADTPHDFGGLAVGLYITKEIVTRHGGRVWFESEEGEGSTFYFSLPLDLSP